MARLHAHVATDSADCDGRYSAGHITTASEGQDDRTFQADVLGLYLPLESAGEVTVTFRPDGFAFTEPTEEGYRTVDVTWCTDSDTDRKTTRRDFSAEAAGY